MLRWLHMVTGAVTVGGFIAGVIGRQDPEAFSIAKRIFVWHMGAAALWGSALMRSPAIWALIGAVLLSAGSLHFFFRRLFLPSGLMLFGSLLVMVTIRHEVRILNLRGSFDPSSWKIVPQWPMLSLFLISFVVALALLAYMLQLFFRTPAEHRAVDN